MYLWLCPDKKIFHRKQILVCNVLVDKSITALHINTADDNDDDDDGTIAEISTLVALACFMELISPHFFG